MELEGIACHHCNELYPQLPSIAGKAGDLDEVRFVNREHDDWISEYLADLHGFVDEIAKFVVRGDESAIPAVDALEDEDEEMPDQEDFTIFLSQVPACCNEFLSQAEFALKEDEIQDACYRIGFVSGCVEAFDVYVNDETHSSCRAVATAWGYLPYIGCILDDDPEIADEERSLNDAIFILGLVHGLLWFSDTDFPLDELAALLVRLPTAQ